MIRSSWAMDSTAEPRTATERATTEQRSRQALSTSDPRQSNGRSNGRSNSRSNSRQTRGGGQRQRVRADEDNGNGAIPYYIYM